MKKKKKVKSSLKVSFTTVMNEMSEIDFYRLSWMSINELKGFICVVNRKSETNELYLLNNGEWLFKLRDVPELTYESLRDLSNKIIYTAKTFGGFDKLSNSLKEFENLCKVS